jgi:hypothetical protein
LLIPLTARNLGEYGTVIHLLENVNTKSEMDAGSPVSPLTNSVREAIARDHIRYKAVLKAWLMTASVFFILSGGSPWTSSGLMDSIMGRVVDGSIWGRFFAHYLLTLLYTLAIAFSIYRFGLGTSIALAGLVGIILYALNFLVLRLLLNLGGPEADVFLAHIAFSFLTAAAYKGLSVPRVRLPEPQTA